MTTVTMSTSILEVFAVIVLLALAHTLLVGVSARPGPADRAFAEDPTLAAARAGVVGLR